MSALVQHEPGEIVVVGAGTAANARGYAERVLQMFPAAVANLSRARKQLPQHGLTAWMFTYPAVALGAEELQRQLDLATSEAVDLIEKIGSATEDSLTDRAALELRQSRQRAIRAILAGVPR